MKQIAGGVCAATGFSASGVHCGIRKNKTKRDLALIYSSVPASAAAVYTTNLVKGAPLVVTKQHLADGKAQAIICNSGNANTCNANGIEIAEQMSSLLGQALHIKPSDVVVASTGVIGQPLDIAPIAAGIPAAMGAMSSGWPITPVEATTTSDGLMCRACPRRLLICSAISMPLALQVLALPLLQMMACALPSARCCFVTTSGAPLTRLVV